MLWAGCCFDVFCRAHHWLNGLHVGRSYSPPPALTITALAKRLRGPLQRLLRTTAASPGSSGYSARSAVLPSLWAIFPVTWCLFTVGRCCFDVFCRAHHWLNGLHVGRSYSPPPASATTELATWERGPLQRPLRTTAASPASSGYSAGSAVLPSLWAIFPVTWCLFAVGRCCFDVFCRTHHWLNGLHVRRSYSPPSAFAATSLAKRVRGPLQRPSSTTAA